MKVIGIGFYWRKYWRKRAAKKPDNAAIPIEQMLWRKKKGRNRYPFDRNAYHQNNSLPDAEIAMKDATVALICPF